MKKVLGIIGIAIILASCGSTRPYHASGITPLNKQYRANCKQMGAWIVLTLMTLMVFKVLYDE